MTYLVATLAGILSGGLLGFGVGLGAAELFTHRGGSGDGANGVDGFLYIGPFGLVAGFLMGFGIVVRFAEGNLAIANGAAIGGVCILALGGLAIVLALARRPGSGRKPAR